MSKKIVTTINNETLPISQCRVYNKKYYKIGDVNVENSGDCYKIDDKYYRFETGQIVFNHTEKKYCLKNNNLIYGLVENNKKGWFSNTKTKVRIFDENNHSIYAINQQVLDNNLNYRECLSSGDFLHISLIPAKEFNRIKVPSKDYKFSLPYDSKGITDKYINIYNNLYDSKISYEIEDLSKIIEDLTFGLEFETIAGYLPPRITNKLGLIPLRDGSIPGIEYVTIPLSGSKGLQTIEDTVKELKKRTKYDYKCSLHLHLGNIPRTKEFILAFFKLTLFIQDELFSMFPIYKKYNLGIKNKNYSKPYSTFNFLSKIDNVIDSSNIDKNFSVLFDYLANQPKGYFRQGFNYNLDAVKVHPQDQNSSQKWNITNRYYFHNFIPLIFGNKQTIEFRIHTPTYDMHKIFMFLALNSILVNFTKANVNEILRNPNFFDNHYGLESIVQNHLTFLDKKRIFKNNNAFGLNSIYDSIRQYINFRKREVERYTAEGKIIIDEDILTGYSKNIYFNGQKVIETDYHKKDVKLDEVIIEEEIAQPTPVLNKKTIIPQAVTSGRNKYNTAIQQHFYDYDDHLSYFKKETSLSFSTPENSTLTNLNEKMDIDFVQELIINNYETPVEEESFTNIVSDIIN